VLPNNRVDPLLPILRQHDAVARFEESCLKDPAYLGFVVDQKERRVVHTPVAFLQITEPKERGVRRRRRRT